MCVCFLFCFFVVVFCLWCSVLFFCFVFCVFCLIKKNMSDCKYNKGAMMLN